MSFLLVGCCLIAADWAVFVALTALGMAVAPASILGRVVGALLGFSLNGSVTFGSIRSPVLGRRPFARFVLLWIVLTTMSTVLVTVLAGQLSLYGAWFAKLVVEAGMAVLSFLASRYWVYR